MKSTLLFSLALFPALAIGQAATTAAPQAQEAIDAAATTEHRMIRAGEIQWGPGPAPLPKGVGGHMVWRIVTLGLETAESGL